MGNFSRNTFDALKHYVGVRLQQGVPIVDADWNEGEDLRRHELRSFIRWFVGDGVPQGNDGFAVHPAAETNDFRIRGGPAGAAGRILVDGWEVVNETDLRYTQQPLFNNAALAAEWGVDPLPPLTTPAGNRTDLVYLDAWEREVDSTEDPDQLVNPAIGVETAVRLRREWAVRVVEGSSALPAAPAGHAYQRLALLSRTGGSAAIPGGAIADQRRTGLSLAAAGNNVAAVQAEVTAARGAQASLDARLDASLAENGQLRPNTVGNAQVANGALGEAKVAFDGAAGHNHSGGAQGRQIGSAGLADDSVLYDKIKWQVLATGSLTGIGPGQSQDATVSNAYDGRILFPVLTTVDVQGQSQHADLTVQLIYRNTAGAPGFEKFITFIRVTNLSTSSAPANVVWHVYTISEV